MLHPQPPSSVITSGGRPPPPDPPVSPIPPIPALPPFPPAPLLELLLGDVMQMPPSQTPLEHIEPSGLGGLEQAPVDGSQVPESWHSSEGAQSNGTLD